MEYKDYYKVLGVDKKVAQADLKKKYRKLAVQFHPDKNPDDAAAEKRFKEISEAYEVLGDPEKRRKYDEMGANWQQYEHFQNQGGAGRRSYASGGYQDPFGGGGFSDFFNAFFGGGGGAGFGGQDFGQRAPRRQSTQATLSLPFYEALDGVSKVVELDGTKIRLNIKPGAYDGLKLKVSGKGRNGGDLLLTLAVGKPSGIEVNGLDITEKVSVDFYAAVLGGKAAVDTVRGKISVPLGAGTQPGKKLRLKGKGMVDYDRPERKGDLILELHIKIPAELSAEEKELFEKLQELRK